MFEFMQNFNLVQWVTALGYLGIFIVVFLEMGIFFGFFLPGDSLVFTAGMLAARGVFEIEILIPLLIITAIIAYALGYWFGDKLGHWLLGRKETFWFKKSYIARAHNFYIKHGGKALVLGRLIPIIRTFVPIVAGMGKMKYRSYFFFNILGALVWGGGITLVGYYVGNMFPAIVDFLLPIVVLIVILSIIPGIWQYFRERRSN